MKRVAIFLSMIHSFAIGALGMTSSLLNFYYVFLGKTPLLRIQPLWLNFSLFARVGTQRSLVIKLSKEGTS